MEAANITHIKKLAKGEVIPVELHLAELKKKDKQINKLKQEIKDLEYEVYVADCRCGL